MKSKTSAEVSARISMLVLRDDGFVSQIQFSQKVLFAVREKDEKNNKCVKSLFQGCHLYTLNDLVKLHTPFHPRRCRQTILLGTTTDGR